MKLLSVPDLGRVNSCLTSHSRGLHSPWRILQNTKELQRMNWYWLRTNASHPGCPQSSRLLRVSPHRSSALPACASPRISRYILPGHSLRECILKVWWVSVALTTDCRCAPWLGGASKGDPVVAARYALTGLGFKHRFG